MSISDELQSQMAQVAAERNRRQREALKLYRPMDKQAAFHDSPASERIVRGGNRSGKSMSAFAETASAATGIPIIGPNGSPLPFKYPTKRPLLIWVIGYDQRHVGGTIYRMLFRPGASFLPSGGEIQLPLGMRMVQEGPPQRMAVRQMTTTAKVLPKPKGKK